MLVLEEYINALLGQLHNTFNERFLYMGLQGSRLRNEHREDSDIDIMVIIDNITADDLKQYKNILINIGSYELSCGFICGKEELACWNPLEICHLIHTTEDIYNALTDYLPSFTAADEKNFIKLSIGNLYHELCHRYVHSDLEKNKTLFPLTCRSVFFIMQDLIYLEKGKFYNSKAKLGAMLEGDDKAVFDLSLEARCRTDCEFDRAFSLLLSWCRNTLKKLNT